MPTKDALSGVCKASRFKPGEVGKKEDNPIRFFRDPSRGAFEIKQYRNGLHAKRPHYHDEISIGLVEKGSCMVSVSEGQFPVCETWSSSLPARCTHAAHAPEKPGGFHMLYRDPAFAEREFGVVLPRGAHLVSPSPVRNAENVKDLFTSLIEEDAESTRGRNAIAALLALILAGRHGNQAGSVRRSCDGTGSVAAPPHDREQPRGQDPPDVSRVTVEHHSHIRPESLSQEPRRNSPRLSNDPSGQPCQKTAAPHVFSRRRGERSRFLRPEPFLRYSAICLFGPSRLVNSLAGTLPTLK